MKYVLYKMFYYNFVDFRRILFNFASFFHAKISIVLFYSSPNKVNLWSACHDIVPIKCQYSNKLIFFCQRSDLELTSHGIFHYLWSADLSKSFSQLIVLIFTFLNTFFNRFESVELPHVAYIVIRQL